MTLFTAAKTRLGGAAPLKGDRELRPEMTDKKKEKERG